MVSSRLRALIEAIARDRTSGAAELAVRAAEALRLARREELDEAARAVMAAQPAMASVYNAAQAALQGEDPEAFIERLRNAPAEIARRAAPLLAGRVVLTHSYSATVIAALTAAHPARVLSTESQPGGEGARTAAVTGGSTIPDAAVYRAMSEVQIAVVGADAVTPDTVVNKIGTALIALAAREWGVPCYVLCGSEKFVPPNWSAEVGGLFEATPRAWFTAVITEQGLK